MDFVAKPSKYVTFACALELLPFRRYLELCVQIFRRDRSGPETHESGGDAPRVGPHGGTPTENLNFTKSSALSYPGPLQNQSIQSAILDRDDKNIRKRGSETRYHSGLNLSF